MSETVSERYVSFVWVPELYEAVQAIGKQPADFNAESLERLYQALLLARVPPSREMPLMPTRLHRIGYL